MRRKHVPQRTCVGCRKVRPKRELIRIIRTPTGEVEIDETGKKSGRGAYLCRNRTCWEIALAKGYVGHALKTAIKPAELSALQEYGRALPDAGEGQWVR